MNLASQNSSDTGYLAKCDADKRQPNSILEPENEYQGILVTPTKPVIHITHMNIRKN